MKSFLEEDKWILFIISIFFLLSFLSFNSNIWWDSATYIGMGKFLFGQGGFWEPSRPLVWPLFLGAVWKVGNVIVFGKVLGMLFGAGCVYLTYMIGREIFDKRVALVSALFLAFIPAFFFFSSRMLSGVPSLFFMLLSVYFFINKRYFLTGLFAGIAFLTRFLELFAFFVILALFLVHFRKEKNFLMNLFYIFIGFLAVVVPYLIFNYFIYGNIFYPFDMQLFLTKKTGSMYHGPFWFYFVNLFRENILLVFALFGIVLVFKKQDYKKFTILFSFLVFFTFFTFIAQKEVRFMLLFLPHLCILASYGIFSVFNKIKNKKIVFSLFLLLFLVWIGQTAYYIKYISAWEVNPYAVFQNYLGEAKEDIWISNPIFAVYSDEKIDELMYHPTFNHDKFIYLKDNLNNAGNVLINTCDLYCEPYNEFCEIDKAELVELLKNNLEIVFSKKEGKCESYIFRR